jgi:hypothetical protein
MARLWKEGLIMGFVTKQAAENMLMQKQSGCFLLRFELKRFFVTKIKFKITD